MTIIETSVGLATKRDHIKRIMRKSDKEKLACSIATIKQICDSELVSEKEKLEKIDALVTCAYW